MSTTASPGTPNPHEGDAAAGPNRGPRTGGSWWRRMLHPLRRMTLRTKLVFSVVALVAVLGVVVSLVSALFLRTYLVGQLDHQVEYAASRAFYAAMGAVNEPGGVTASDLVTRVLRTPGLSAGTVVAVVSDQGDVKYGYLSPRDPSASQQSVSGNANANIAAIAPSSRPVDVDLGGTLGQVRMEAVQLPSGTLVIGLPLADVNATTAQLLTIFLLVTAVAIAAAGGVGLLIVVLALRPLDRVA
ncbi:MAG: hypothetical protein ACTHNC_16580, partial [Humibacter sp.]